MCAGALLSCGSTAFVLSFSRITSVHTPTRVQHANLAPTMEAIGVGASVPRSSPLALQTLRDMASISAALREMQQTVRPMAEHGLPAQQGELLATLNAGVGELQTSVATLQSVADGARTGSSDTSLGGVSGSDDGPQPEDLSALRTQAQRLVLETQGQSQVLLSAKAGLAGSSRSSGGPSVAGAPVARGARVRLGQAGAGGLRADGYRRRRPDQRG